MARAGNPLKRAVLYTDAGGLQDLDTLIDPSLGWVLLGANDINDAGQIVGYAFNNFTGQTHAVRLRPTAAPPPECTFHCLRSTGIDLRSGVLRPGMRRSVTGEGHGPGRERSPDAQALVVGTWTQPDGSSHDDQRVDQLEGRGGLRPRQGPPGTYTLTIVNIVLSLYTFDPSQSVLSKSITPRRGDRSSELDQGPIAGRAPRALRSPARKPSEETLK